MGDDLCLCRRCRFNASQRAIKQLFCVSFHTFLYHEMDTNPGEIETSLQVLFALILHTI